MANPLKKLAGQTVVYGMGTIIPRLLNYLLVPYYTSVFVPEVYGVITELYAYVAFLLAFLTFGMETAFFRYSKLRGNDSDVYSTVLLSVLSVSLAFLIIIATSYNSLADLMSYKGNSEFILFIAFIVAMDAVGSIPSALLRQLNKAKKFAIIKLSSVSVNIFLNLLLITGIPALLKSYPESFLNNYFKESDLLSYVLISNVFSSATQLLLLRKEIGLLRFKFNKKLFKELLAYAMPIAVIGMAGMLNEVSDRILFKHLFISPDVMSELGIYGANYKLAVFMTLFIQMFRYAAEPFFFSQANESNAKQIYADVMKYFTWFAFGIFLLITLYIDVFKYFIKSSYWEGLQIVPIVLLANLFLGIFYNLSVWYKLNNLTRYGAYIAVLGSIITILINVIFVPIYGYIASAWGHLVCTSTMIVISYFWGRKHYPIQYDLKSIALYSCLAIALFFISRFVGGDTPLIRILISSALIIMYLGVFAYKEKSFIQSLVTKRK
jgi:O-antigen/teichoic acid export membrane protein